MKPVRDIDELRQLVLKSNNYEGFCVLIKTLPCFRHNAKEIEIYDRKTKIKMRELIREIALKCIDLIEIEQDYLKTQIKDIDILDDLIERKYKND